MGVVGGEEKKTLNKGETIHITRRALVIDFLKRVHLFAD